MADQTWLDAPPQAAVPAQQDNSQWLDAPPKAQAVAQPSQPPPTFSKLALQNQDLQKSDLQTMSQRDMSQDSISNPTPSWVPPAITSTPLEDAQAGYGISPDVKAPQEDSSRAFSLNTAFQVGLYNKQINPAEANELSQHPVISGIGQGIGSLAKLMGIGAAVVNPLAAAGTEAAMAAEGGISMMPWIQGAANVGAGGATFGISEAIDKLSKDLQGGGLTAQDLGDVAKQTATGAGFGVVGAVPQVASRITAQGLYMYGTSKMQGADDVSSTVNGFVGAIFGLTNNIDLNLAYKQQAVSMLHQNLAMKFSDLGVPMESAVKGADEIVYGSAIKATGIKDPSKAVEEVLKDPNNNLEYFEKLNQNLKNTPFIRPAGLPGTDAVKQGMESQEPLVQEPPEASGYVPSTVSTTGPEGTKEESVEPVNSQQALVADPHIQNVLNTIKTNDAGTPEAPGKGVLQDLDDLHGNGSQLRDQLYKIAASMESQPNTNDRDIQNALMKYLGRNPDGSLDESNQKHVILVPSIPANREDDMNTPIFDVRNLRTVTIGEMGAYLKAQNDKIQAVNENIAEKNKWKGKNNQIPTVPLIDPKQDLIAQTNRVEGQPKGIEKSVRDAVLLAYERAKSPKPVQAWLDSPPNPYVPQNVPERTKNLLDMWKGSRAKPLPFGMKTSGIPAAGIGLPQEGPVSLDQATTQAAQNASSNLANANDSNPGSVVVDTSTRMQHHTPEQLVSNMSDSNAMNLTHEKVHLDAQISESKVMQDILVKDTGNFWGDIAVALHASLGRIPTKEEMAQLANKTAMPGIVFTGDDVNMSSVADNTGLSSQQAVDQGMTVVSSQIAEDIKKVRDLLKERYSSTSSIPLEEAIEKLLQEPTKDKLKRKFSRAPDQYIKQGRVITPGKWVNGVYEGGQVVEQNLTTPKVFQKSEKQVEESVEPISGMIKAMEKHLDFVGEHYEAEMKKVLSDILPESREIYKNAAIGLSKNSKGDTIVRVIHALNEEYDRHVIKNPSQDNPGTSEHADDINFDNDSQVDTEGGIGGGMLNNESGQTINPADVLHGAAKYVFGGKIGTVVSIDGTYINPIVHVLEVMRNNPTTALEEMIHLKLGSPESKQRDQFKRHFNPSPADEALEPISGFRNVEQAVDGMLNHHLEKLVKYMDEGIAKHFKAHPELLQGVIDRSISEYNHLHPSSPMRPMPGAKYSDDPVRKIIFNILMSDMKDAQEQVLVRDMHHYKFSLNGQGPHLDEFEKHAYVEAIKNKYRIWGIPFTASDEARWQTSREPVFWQLLVNPQVMSNDTLQRSILWFKSQMDNPMWKEEIKHGIYQNADLVKSAITGYSHHGFSLAGAQATWMQKVTNWFSPGAPTGSIKRPGAKLETQQSMNENAALNNYLPVNDFINDAHEQLKKAFLSIKKVQLMKELGKLPLPKLEYGITPIKNAKYVNLREALKENPCPFSNLATRITHSTDKFIQDEANRLTNIMFTPAQIAKGIDIAKAGKGNPFAISSQMVLNEGGWVQSRQDEGFNVWYRGSWSPPYIHKPVKDILDTTLRKYPGFEALPGIGKAIQYAKIGLLINPAFHVPQYIAGMIMSQPIYKQPVYVAKLAGQSVLHTFKIPYIGMKIWQGKYNHEVGDTEQDRADATEFYINGSMVMGSYHSIINNILDLQDKGIIRSRQSQGDNIRDFILSCAGSGTSYLGEMVPKLVLPMMQQLRDNLKAKGYSHEDAVKLTVAMTNRNMNRLSKMSWTDSGVKSILDILSFSSDWTLAPMRNLMMAAISPLGSAALGGLTGAAVGGPEHWLAGTIGGALMTPSVVNRMKELKAFGYRTAAGGAPWLNTATGADIPPRLREKMQADAFNSFLVWSALAWFVYAIWQFANNRKQPYIWKNEYPEAVDSGDTDVNGKEIYWHTNFFKAQRDMMSLMNPLVEQAIQNVSHNPEFRTGLPGPMQMINSKLSGLNPLMEVLTNKDHNGDAVWDKYTNDHAQVLEQMGSHVIAGYAPSQGFLGSGAPQVPVGDNGKKNELKDFFYKTAITAGLGLQTGGGKELDEDKRKVGEVNFWKKQAASKTDEQLQAAFSKGLITKQAFKSAEQRINEDEFTYEKANRSALSEYDDLKNQH